MAIMVNSLNLMQWEHQVLDHLKASGKVEAVLWICKVDQQATGKPGFLERLKKFRYRNLLWKIFQKIRKEVSPLRDAGIYQPFSAVPVILVEPEFLGKNRERISEDDIRKIKDHQPDFILRFGFNILEGEILKTAPHGIWSYHHDDPEIIRGGPPGFWEVYLGLKNTGLVLQRLNEKLDGGFILRKGRIKTVLHSYRGNLAQLMECGVEWPAQVAEEIFSGRLHSDGKEYKRIERGKLFTYPSNLSMLKFIFTLFFRRLNFHFRDLLFAEKWNVGIIPESDFSSIIIEKAKWFPELRAGSFIADPFPSLIHPDSIYLEYYNYQSGKGEIHRWNVGGRFQEKILSGKYHLSYPFSLKIGEKELLVPEQADSNKVLAYYSAGANQFSVLLTNFSAVDPTLVFYQGKWWLFCSNEKKGANSHLYLFFADGLEDEFITHPQNPIKIDVEGARPGGGLVFRDGKLYRPGQNCSRTYGASIIWFEILRMDEWSYEEKRVHELFPDAKGQYSQGLHTINKRHDGWLVDGKRYEFSFWHTYHKLEKKF